MVAVERERCLGIVKEADSFGYFSEAIGFIESQSSKSDAIIALKDKRIQELASGTTNVEADDDELIKPASKTENSDWDDKQKAWAKEHAKSDLLKADWESAKDYVDYMTALESGRIR